MRKLTTTIILVFSLLTSITINAQDQKAKGILDKLSAKTKTYNSMQAAFDYKMQNKAEDIDEMQSGSLITKGDKYNLSIAGQVLISDGKTVWTVLEDAEEVQVNDVSTDEEEEDFISPTNILTLWEKGFKYKYDKATTIEGKALDIINLYPKEADEKGYHTIKLFIDQKLMTMSKIVIKGKDGTDFTYLIKEFKTNTSPKENTFTFDKAKYADYEIVDLR